MDNELTVVDGILVDTRSVLTMADTRLRRIPRHVLPYSHTLIVNGEPHPISDTHVEELGMFASVDQKTGQVTNGSDRKAALVVVLPKGNFECIDLDNPDAKPTCRSKW